jgi:Phasin protein
MPSPTSAHISSIAKVQAEALRFTLDRMRKSMEMPARLAECKGPTELFEVQAGFARTMVSDYASESEKLLALSLEGLRHSADEASRMTGAVSGERTRGAA